MIAIAGAAVVLATILEFSLLPLFSVPDQERWLLGGLLAGVNFAVSLLVGYFSFNSVPVPSRRSQDHALEIVHETLPHLRQGLNRETARKTATIILRMMTDVRAVAITSGTELLAFIGRDSQNTALRAEVENRVSQALAQGRQTVTSLSLPSLGRQELPLLIVPLRCHAELLGGLALVGWPGGQFSRTLVRSAEMVAELLGMQVELGQLDRQRQLTTEAELNALRAQIKPHFLFNTINTIVSYSRDDAEMTRRMLIKLAELFRGSMRPTGQFVTFYEEYRNIRNYLFLEQARFHERLQVVYDIDPQVLKVSIPALSVQPLVENAVRHGVALKSEGGTVSLVSYLDFLTMKVNVVIKDDGVGMDPERIPELLRPSARQKRDHGMGLSNVNERLKRLYGGKYSLHITSAPGRGTRVHLRIPMR